MGIFKKEETNEEVLEETTPQTQEEENNEEAAEKLAEDKAMENHDMKEDLDGEDVPEGVESTGLIDYGTTEIKEYSETFKGASPLQVMLDLNRRVKELEKKVF